MDIETRAGWRNTLLLLSLTLLAVILLLQPLLPTATSFCRFPCG